MEISSSRNITITTIIITRTGRASSSGCPIGIITTIIIIITTITTIDDPEGMNTGGAGAMAPAPLWLFEN
jgi:hypothetical protein